MSVSPAWTAFSLLKLEKIPGKLVRGRQKLKLDGMDGILPSRTCPVYFQYKGGDGTGPFRLTGGCHNHKYSDSMQPQLPAPPIPSIDLLLPSYLWHQIPPSSSRYSRESDQIWVQSQDSGPVDDSKPVMQAPTRLDQLVQYTNVAASPAREIANVTNIPLPQVTAALTFTILNAIQTVRSNREQFTLILEQIHEILCTITDGTLPPAVQSNIAKFTE
ncbi:hypothetical protein DFH08DRAFT_812272 [Mycena albidolilacea]|uniref:Uncharacterized protein n=1 Tax=Mycena albidolilacea TaxID=1033008 RepID=A0AAD6ZU96_9AGAR|nr:hypothetical protein DFH08DRAFT_812272 [Mycena albidolilacea]